MFNKAVFILAIIAVFGTTMQTAQAAHKKCLPIGGVALADFIAEGEGEPIVISATMTGSVQSTAGKILAQRVTPTGLEMDLEHYFQRDDGGRIYTQDLGVLTAVPGRPGRFMLEVTYVIQPEESRGTLEGYEGTFQSFGLVDLSNPEDMKGLVRYGGEICHR